MFGTFRASCVNIAPVVVVAVTGKRVAPTRDLASTAEPPEDYLLQS